MAKIEGKRFKRLPEEKENESAQSIREREKFYAAHREMRHLLDRANDLRALEAISLNLESNDPLRPELFELRRGWAKELAQRVLAAEEKVKKARARTEKIGLL